MRSWQKRKNKGICTRWMRQNRRMMSRISSGRTWTLFRTHLSCGQEEVSARSASAWQGQRTLFTMIICSDRRTSKARGSVRSRLPTHPSRTRRPSPTPTATNSNSRR